MITKTINIDREFYGFKMRTRRHWYDDKIIHQCLDESKDIYRMPKEPKVVIDIGANIGCISLVAARRGARVYAFEPASNNFETLVHNVDVNSYSDKIKCINLGVGKPGKTKLYIHPSNAGANSSYVNISNRLYEDNAELVHFISIHEVFNNYNIGHCDFMKLDCEGSEYDIIKDMDDEFASKISQISVEFHDKSKMNELICILSKWYKSEHLTRYEYCFKK